MTFISFHFSWCKYSTNFPNRQIKSKYLSPYFQTISNNLKQYKKIKLPPTIIRRCTQRFYILKTFENISNNHKSH